MNKTKKSIFTGLLLIILLLAAALLFRFFSEINQDPVPQEIDAAVENSIGSVKSENAADDSGVRVSSRINDIRVGKKIEDLFLSGNNLNVANVESILKRNDFEQLLGKMYNQSSLSPDSLELTSSYENAVVKSLEASNSNLQLQKLVCGRKICAAIINGTRSDQRQYESWVDSNLMTGKIPAYATVEYVILQEGDSASYRMAFSTDPAANGVVIRLGRH